MKVNFKFGDVKVRRTWGSLNPVTRIHGESKQGKKPKYNKADRNSWKKSISW